jgi:F-type H+-transporting ATPase subunit gamma
MEELVHIQGRLENVRSVEPVLNALHTISLGGWQMAVRRGAEARRYEARIEALLPPLLPHLPGLLQVALRKLRRAAVMVVGSERGLCGRYNATAVEAGEAHVDRLVGDGVQVEVVALGSRARRLLERRERALASARPLSTATLPSFDLAHDLTCEWLARYEAHELDAVDLAYNTYRGMGSYEPVVVRLIPPPLPEDEPGREPPFPTIIETDPSSLYERLVGQWTAVRLYGLLLDAAAAEHAARFAVMEAATQNAASLIADLTLQIQTARQQAITREMQELAAGAGMMG